MSERMTQVNDILRQELATIAVREINFVDGLITITKVKCSPDLKHADVLISVLPENRSGSALEELKKNNHIIAKELGKKIKLRKIPKLSWKIDEQERYAIEIDKVFDEIRREDDENAYL